MSSPVQQFQLIVDRLQPPPSAKRPEPIEVPPGVWHLGADADGRPCLLAGTPADPDAAPVLEAVGAGRSQRLMLLNPAGPRPRVNGQPPPRVALLNVKDQLQLGDWVLHVTMVNRPQVGTPPAEVIGKECPVCRFPIAADTTVYVCHGCGTPLHCEGEEKGADRLECVHLGSECPVCNAPIVMKAGYVYLPEL
jgi:hypothetical protein